MRNIASLFAISSSLLVLACETAHHSVATVDSAGAGGATGSSTSATATKGGAGPTGSSSTASTGGYLAVGGAGQGGIPIQSGASSGNGGSPSSGGAAHSGVGANPTTGAATAAGSATATGGNTAQAGRGGSSSSGGNTQQSGNGGTSATGGTTAQAGSGTCEGEYTTCGCGCCGSATTANVACYYPSLGESLASVIAADQAARASANCAYVGCSLGERNVCCADVPTDPSDASTYDAALGIGGEYDQIRIKKQTPNGKCIVLTLAGLASTSSSRLYRMTLPSDWSVSAAAIRDCSVSAEFNSGVGGVGTVAFQTDTGSCSIAIHATVFLAPESGTVQTARFDADGIALGVTGCP